MTNLPSIVITRHRCPVKGKCFFAVVSVGKRQVSRSFQSRNTTRNWAIWALENFESAFAAQEAAKVEIREEAA